MEKKVSNLSENGKSLSRKWQTIEITGGLCSGVLRPVSLQLVAN